MHLYTCLWYDTCVLEMMYWYTYDTIRKYMYCWYFHYEHTHVNVLLICPLCACTYMYCWYVHREHAHVYASVGPDHTLIQTHAWISQCSYQTKVWRLMSIRIIHAIGGFRFIGCCFELIFDYHNFSTSWYNHRKLIRTRYVIMYQKTGHQWMYVHNELGIQQNVTAVM